jgi:hypothetical protein
MCWSIGPDTAQHDSGHAGPTRRHDSPLRFFIKMSNFHPLFLWAMSEWLYSVYFALEKVHRRSFCGFDPGFGLRDGWVSVEPGFSASAATAYWPPLTIRRPPRARLPAATAAPHPLKRNEEGKRRGKEIGWGGHLTYGVYVGPTLTQPPRRPKPGSKPPKDLERPVLYN